ncbi:MAG: helix-turn-helix domain-containing protein [Candidatus Nomurabacteria bacterium]|jgi:IS30 family transposase|nr:helix-turn-helix domain-containing protein [Candidatus Nomurabacteria bacterium]
MSYSHLTTKQRVVIETLMQEGLSQRAIARQLGVSAKLKAHHGVTDELKTKMPFSFLSEGTGGLTTEKWY